MIKTIALTVFVFSAITIVGCNQTTQQAAKNSAMTNVSTTDLVYNVDGLT